MVTRSGHSYEWNGECPVCGFYKKSYEIRKRWDGMWVCKDCWESRHPMDFYRARNDTHKLPFILHPLEGNIGTNSVPEVSSLLDAPLNGVWTDISQYSRAYSLNTAPTLSDHVPTISAGGGAFYCDPSDHYTNTSFVTYPESSSNIINLNDGFTIELDFNISSTGVTPWMYPDTLIAFGNRSDAPSSGHGSIYVKAQPTPHLYVYHSKFSVWESAKVIAANTWYHLKVSRLRNSTQFTVEIDGIQDANSPFTGSIDPWGIDTGHTTLGADHHGSWGLSGLDGYLRNVEVTRYHEYVGVVDTTKPIFTNRTVGGSGVVDTWEWKIDNFKNQVTFKTEIVPIDSTSYTTTSSATLNLPYPLVTNGTIRVFTKFGTFLGTGTISGISATLPDWTEIYDPITIMGTYGI